MGKVKIDAIPNQKRIQEAPEQQKEEAVAVMDPKDKKKLGIAIISIVALFVVIITGFKLYNSFNPEPVTVDEHHRANLEGKLDSQKGYIYNGYSFVKVDGLWWTEVLRGERYVQIPLHFSPKEVEDITLQGKLNKSFFDHNEVYVAIDPAVVDKYYTLAVSELSMNLAQGIGVKPIGSCTTEDPVCENRTIVSCENTQGKPVIELVAEGETAEIELAGTCIKLSGNEYELTKAANRLLYHFYGVI